MGKRTGAYLSIQVESFKSNEPGHRYPIEVRPIPGEAFPVHLLVECPMRMRTDYPVGTVFRILAKLKETSFDRPHLYTSYKWPFEIVAPSAKTRTARLIDLARVLAAENPRFQSVLGPGAGDKATREFMSNLQDRARHQFGSDYSEKRICGKNSLAVDFYFPDEETIVEVALGLPNAASEFEKDVLKAIIAQETGLAVSKLVFISRAGAGKKCSQPGRTAVRTWAKAKHRLDIEVHDLHGEPRTRKRR